MKPIRSFFYLLTILAGFLLVSYFLNKPVDLQPVAQKDNVIAQIPGALDLIADSLPDQINMSAEEKMFPPKGKSIISFPSGDSTVLKSFFTRLQEARTSNIPSRIIYFGDSQLEGDRVTGAIRTKFQQYFGGGGSGFLAPEMLYSTSRSVRIEHSAGWKKHSPGDFSDEQENISLLFHSAMLPAGQTGWFKLKHLGGTLVSQVFSSMKVFYHCSDSLFVDVKQEGKPVYSGRLAGLASIRALNFRFSDIPSEVEFMFRSKSDLTITAFSLENKNGVQIDNIALRGQVAPLFSRSDMQAMHETVRLVKPALCIWQFGVNLVPYPLDNYDYYREQLVHEIWLLKQLMPDVPVLLVGLSDMARNVQGKMVSYPNIVAIKKAQLEAAALCHCAFWDLEAFMGGPGSMVRWVESQPRLGQKDYIHFTEEGAQYVGTQLGDLLLTEYNHFIKTNSTE